MQIRMKMKSFAVTLVPLLLLALLAPLNLRADDATSSQSLFHTGIAASSPEASPETSAAASAKSPPALFHLLIDAIQNDQYAQFSSVISGEMKAGIPKAKFDLMSKHLAPRLRSGLTPTYLGAMREKGYDIYIWKLSFGDEGDDLLARLAIKNHIVAGFFLD